MQSLVTEIVPLLLFMVAFHVHYSISAVKSDLPNFVSRTIIVDKSGLGNFTSVQQAIDSVPSDNLSWTRVLISSGTYIEKVVIPQDKPYIILEGDPNGQTTIQYGDAGSVVESPTFKMQADNLVARHVTFKNTYNTPLEMDDVERRRVTWPPAAVIAGEKASFYRCRFIGLQDTLSDSKGRHYFYDSYVEGAIDFIWGNGQSMYEVRYFLEDHTGTTPDSSVLFAGTYMEDIIIPEGWQLWSIDSEQGGFDHIFRSKLQWTEANMSQRVEWEKQLSAQELMSLTKTTNFINQEGWIDEEPS